MTGSGFSKQGSWGLIVNRSIKAMGSEWKPMGLKNKLLMVKVNPEKPFFLNPNQYFLLEVFETDKNQMQHDPLP